MITVIISFQCPLEPWAKSMNEKEQAAPQKFHNFFQAHTSLYRVIYEIINVPDSPREGAHS